jgi:hypothetical protein
MLQKGGLESPNLRSPQCATYTETGSRGLEHIRAWDIHLPCVPKERRSSPRRIIPEVYSPLTVLLWLVQNPWQILQDKGIDTVEFKLGDHKLFRNQVLKGHGFRRPLYGRKIAGLIGPCKRNIHPPPCAIELGSPWTKVYLYTCGDG